MRRTRIRTAIAAAVAMTFGSAAHTASATAAWAQEPDAVFAIPLGGPLPRSIEECFYPPPIDGYRQMCYRNESLGQKRGPEMRTLHAVPIREFTESADVQLFNGLVAVLSFRVNHRD